MRNLAALCLLFSMVAADEAPAKKRTLKTKLTTGDRYRVTNTISVEVRTIEKQGDQETSRTEYIQRKEKFVDEVKEAGELGMIEIERNFLVRYEKLRTGKNGRPEIIRSPLSGRKVTIRERNRRREVKADGSFDVDPLMRRTIGLEIDWRDILPDDPVAPGDTWKADTTALARRIAAHLDAGTRSRMDVRYEGDVEYEGFTCAKLWVDWRLEGMRDRNLYTKVMLAGDVFFDFKNGRFLGVDLTGRLLVRGAIIGDGAPMIIKGEGPVALKIEISPIPPAQAAAPAGD